MQIIHPIYAPFLLFTWSHSSIQQCVDRCVRKKKGFKKEKICIKKKCKSHVSAAHPWYRFICDIFTIYLARTSHLLLFRSFSLVLLLSLSLSLSRVLSSARTVPNVVVIAATSGKITLKTSATSIIEGNSKGQIEKQQSRPYIIQQNHSGRGIWPVMGSLILATIPRYAPCLQTDRLELN